MRSEFNTLIKALLNKAALLQPLFVANNIIPETFDHMKYLSKFKNNEISSSKLHFN